MKSQGSMAVAQAFNGTYKKLLGVKASDIYQGKSHMECSNFCQQYKDNFATGKATY